ncbi:tRNA (adenosine(37)-N6)-threonylcarbamoyltransferase complex ATPase subunit type 1 TsaE [Acidobacteriota bacterium]
MRCPRALKKILDQQLTSRREISSDNPDETFEAGRETAAIVPQDGTVLLVGELGAGKTLFAKGLGQGLGIDPSEITSPTYIIVEEHRGSRQVFHIDLYRIETDAEYDEIGLWEILDGPGVKIVEWAEKLDPERCACHVAVFIEDAGGDKRRIEIYSSDI